MASPAEVGDRAPDFTPPSTQGEITLSLSAEELERVIADVG